MHAERVDGYNPLAVIDAFERKRAVLLEGRGPVLLDTVTYRISGHSPSDASATGPKEEIERWQQADPIPAYCSSCVTARRSRRSSDERDAAGRGRRDDARAVPTRPSTSRSARE